MPEITGYVLAGGESARMGECKGLLMWKNKPFVSHIYEALRPLCAEVYIVSSRKEYDAFPYEKIEDAIPNKGPMGGIYTALLRSPTNTNFILSVDSPLVSTDLLRWIKNEHKTSHLITQLASDKKTYPLIGIYDSALLSLLKKAIEQNELRLQRLVNSVSHAALDVPPQWKDQVRNINTREDFLALH